MAERKVWTEQDLKNIGFVADEPEVYSITAANSKHSEAIDKRAKQYALRMLLRIICIILACLVDGWMRWGFVALAGILPWAAVVIANGDDRASSGGEFMQYLTEDQQLSLTQAERRPHSSDDTPGEHDQGENKEATFAAEDTPLIIDGEIIDNEH